MPKPLVSILPAFEPPSGTAQAPVSSRFARGEERLQHLGALELANRIYEIALLAHHSSDLEQVLEAIVDRILHETGACYAAIALVDGSSVVHRTGSLCQGKPTRYPLAEGIVGQVIESGEAETIDELGSFEGHEVVAPKMRSAACVPLHLGSQTIGALLVESREPAKFGAAVLAILQAIATPVVLAHENARLLHEERRRLDQLTFLNRLSRVLTSTVELDELLQRTAEEVRDHLGYPVVALGLLDDDQQHVVLRAVSTSVPLEVKIGHRQAMGQGITGQVVAEGQRLLVDDVRDEQNYVQTHPDVRCEMCCPLRSAGRVLGFLDCEGFEPGAFDKNDLMLLETVADHISTAVENILNLRRMNRLRDDLATMVVHDLRNPLTVIHSTLGLLSSLKDMTGEPTRALRPWQYIKHAQAASDEMLVMIDSLLELQKIESGLVKVRRTSFAPAELVHSVLQCMTIVAEARQVNLVSEIGDQLPAALLDRELMLRVLQNLVANALKFTPEDGHVTVRLGSASPELLGKRLPEQRAGLLFSVNDTGLGIPAQEHERIFEKFAVVESRRAGQKYSTGLGLALCKHAILAHGGTIWVESEPGKGSTFLILVPAGDG